MKRFSPQNNFAWTLFFLIFAICCNVANFGTESTRSNNGAATTVLENSTFLTFDAPNLLGADDSRADAFQGDAQSLFERFGESRRVAPKRGFGSESSRFGGTAPISKILKTPSRSAAKNAFGAAFRSFWTCQTVSRPLFLVLKTLRN